MGVTYSNCQVRSDSQQSVVEALRGLLKEPACVSPSIGGWVGVYPEGGSTDPDALAKQLSARLACGVFSWNVHDSDVFYYSLYESGETRDEFNSDPDWGTDPDDEFPPPPDAAERARVRGNPEILLPFCLPGVTHNQIQQILHPAGGSQGVEVSIAFSPVSADQYLFAEVQAADLASLLGMDETLAALGYRYVESGEIRDHTSGSFLLIKADADKVTATHSLQESYPPHKK